MVSTILPRWKDHWQNSTTPDQGVIDSLVWLYPNKFKNSVFDNNVIMAPIMAFFIQKRASIR